jgi:hypothetical protein
MLMCSSDISHVCTTRDRLTNHEEGVMATQKLTNARMAGSKCSFPGGCYRFICNTLSASVGEKGRNK